MSEKSLQLSEQALRLGLAILGLGLATWLAASQPSPRLTGGPKPAVVMEW